MPEGRWHDIGPVEDFRARPVTEIRVDRLTLAVTWNGDDLGVISGACNHVGGPLGQGHLEGDYVVCPWHQWKFHRRSGEGEPGFEQDRVPSHELRVENGRLLVNLEPATKRNKSPHEPHPLARPVRREPGPVRLVGISATSMNRSAPRFSGSDHLLEGGGRIRA